MRIDAVILPVEIDTLSERDLSAATVVVFDVLRATSTMVTALANGTAEIYPVASIPEALEMKEFMPQALLAGERRGVPFDGFDLGNSPLAYRKLGAARIISLTANCCAALRACAGAGRVLIGSLLNMGALAGHLKEESPDSVLLVCAGTVREPAIEDLFAAGMLCSNFKEAALSDAAKITASVFRKYQEDPTHCLHESRRGRELIADNQRADIRWCAHRSLYAVIVEMRDGVICKA
ncbi:MAG: 2-phosphosulfolactate phosphatase [Chthoniobacteraceae bacterium]